MIGYLWCGFMANINIKYVFNNMGKRLLNICILFIYTSRYSCQCFCFPNSQWGITPHDIPPQREDRKLDILENISFLSTKQKHARERQCH